MFLFALLFLLLIQPLLISCSEDRYCGYKIYPGDTCWEFDSATKTGWFYYGNELKFHAWHVRDTGFHKMPFAVMPNKEGHRKDALKGLPKRGPLLHLDEKPLSSMQYTGNASVCYLPQPESAVEGGMVLAILKKVRAAGPKARFYMMDNRTPAFRVAANEMPDCPRPAGRATPLYPDERPNTSADQERSSTEFLFSASPTSFSYAPSPTSVVHASPTSSGSQQGTKRKSPDFWGQWAGWMERGCRKPKITKMTITVKKCT